MYGILITTTAVRTTSAASALRDYVRWEYGPNADSGFLVAAARGRGRTVRPRGHGRLGRVRAWAARFRKDATSLAAKAVE
jgi:hypothetical protein